MRIALLLSFLTIIALTGCDKEQPAPPAPAKKEPVFKKPDQQVNTKLKLEDKLEIKPDGTPPKYAVTYGVTVPTGGWKMTLDSARVEEKHRELRMASIYVTLEEPTDDEVVTQATQTLSADFNGGADVVNGAELFVRRRVKGIVPEYAESYGQMKTAGKQY